MLMTSSALMLLCTLELKSAPKSTISGADTVMSGLCTNTTSIGQRREHQLTSLSDYLALVGHVWTPTSSK